MTVVLCANRACDLAHLEGVSVQIERERGFGGHVPAARLQSRSYFDLRMNRRA